MECSQLWEGASSLPHFIIGYCSSVFNCSIPASPNGKTGNLGSPTSNPVRRNPALIVAGNQDEFQQRQLAIEQFARQG